MSSSLDVLEKGAVHASNPHINYHANSYSVAAARPSKIANPGTLYARRVQSCPPRSHFSFFSIQRSLFICVHHFDPLAVQLGHTEHHPPERRCRHGYFLRRSRSTPCRHVGIPQGKCFRCHRCVAFQITLPPRFSVARRGIYLSEAKHANNIILAFTSFGAFWMSFATILIPGSGVGEAYTNADEFASALGIYLVTWAVVTFLLTWVFYFPSS